MALDPQIVALARAIREVESGGSYEASGASGEGGAYQFMPSTWKAWAGKYLGDPNAKMDKTNQNKVAYYRIKERRDAGLTAAQIASEWNSGNPDAYKQNWKGTNSQGVAYDTPAYVGKVKAAYMKYKPQAEASPVTTEQKTGTVEKVTDFLGMTKLGEAFGTTAAIFSGTSDEINKNALAGAEADRQKAELLKNPNLRPEQRANIMKQLGQATAQPVVTAAEAMPAINYTPKEVYGSALNTAIAATAGGTLKVGRAVQAAAEASKLIQPAKTVGSALLRTVGREAGVGAVYGAASGLGQAMSQNKSGAEIAKDTLYGAGTGALIGGALSGTISGIGALAAKTGASARLINSLIKPLGKEFDFGRNPGQGVVKEGIKANSIDGLMTAIQSKKKAIGEKIGSMLNAPSARDKRVNIGAAIRAVDEKIEQAVKTGEQVLVTRLQGVRKSMTDTFGLSDGVVVSTGKKPLLVSPKQAHVVKQELGEASKWTGQAFDNDVNQARVAAYRALNDEIEKAVPGVKTYQARYGNMLSAERSLERTMSIKQRQNLIGFGEGGLGLGAGVGSVAVGASAFPATLAVIGTVLVKRILSSTAFKTRLAMFLERLSPLESKALSSLSVNEKQALMEYLTDKIKNPSKQLLLPQKAGEAKTVIYGQAPGIQEGQNIVSGRKSAPSVDPVKARLIEIIDSVKNEVKALPGKGQTTPRAIELPAPGIQEGQNVLAGRTAAPVAKPSASSQLDTGKYLFHGTNEDVLSNITKEGLRPMQRGALSLSKDETYAKSFAREGMTPQGKTSPVMLRVDSSYLKGKTLAVSKSKPMSDQLNEVLTKESIPPNAIEIYKNGKWQPLIKAENAAYSKSLVSEAKKYKSAEEFVKAQQTTKTVNLWRKSRFSDGGAMVDYPVIRKEDNITLYQGGDGGQHWTPDKKYAKQFGKVKEKTGSFYKIDNGNRVTDVYVEAPSKSQLTDIWKKANGL